MMKQSIHQRPVEVARSGVNDHPGRLVDDKQMLILEYDFERDVLRFVMRLFWLRYGHAECLFALNFGSRVADWLPARFDRAAADQGLQPLARERRDRISERTVKTPPGMGGRQTH